MKKTKYLYRNCRNYKKWKVKKNQNKNTNGDELPFRESIRDTYKKDGNYFWNYGYLDFTPLYYFIDENVNRDWNDVYSEIIKKIKPKHRWLLEKHLDMNIGRVIVVDYIPYIRSHHTRIAIDYIFVDEEGILRKYNSKEEIFDMVKRKTRRDKLKKLKELYESTLQ